MSNILNEIVTNSISLTECLQRLLIIATKTGNAEISEWCSKELIGYKTEDVVPNYRRFKSLNIVYSGINGRYQLTNQPLQPGFLSDETLKQIQEVTLFENITEVEKRKEQPNCMSRDLTFLSGEVFKNTKDTMFGIGVQCTSIKQIIPQSLYEDIYSAVKIRTINLLNYYERSGIDLDNLDVPSRRMSNEENAQVFDKIVIDGQPYLLPQKENKVVWRIIVPIVIGIVVGIISGVLVFFITNSLVK